MNSTCHTAIKAIPYEVVCNRKPNYKRVDPPLLPTIIEDDIEEDVVDGEQDYSLSRDEQHKLEAENRLREEANIDELDMTMLNLKLAILFCALSELPFWT